jgi:hypothetical protein
MRFTALLLALTCFATTARAQLNSFQGNTGNGDFTSKRTAWATAFGGALTTEGFESTFSSGQSVAFAGVTLSRDGTLDFEQKSDAQMVSQGSNAIQRGMGIGSTSFGGSFVRFTFASPINAFGIDINDHDNLSTHYQLQVNNASSDILSSVAPPVEGDPKAFVGFISNTPFTTVTFTRTDANTGTYDSGQAWDNLQYGFSTAVPEPSSALALATCLGGILLRRRRAA